MRRLLIFIILSFLFLSGQASVKVVSFQWNILAGQKTMSVELSLNDIKYKNGRPFKEFLYKARRASDWQSKSMEYFISEFNEYSIRVGLELNAAEKDTCSQYRLVLVPEHVSGGGKISGHANLIDRSSDTVVGNFEFESEDGDDDDEITLRDSLRDLGERFGKMFFKYLRQ